MSHTWHTDLYLSRGSWMRWPYSGSALLKFSTWEGEYTHVNKPYLDLARTIPQRKNIWWYSKPKNLGFIPELKCTQWNGRREYCVHNFTYTFFSMHLLISIWISHMCLESGYRILDFLSGCILALLKAVCSPLKKILAVNIRNSLLGMRLKSTWSKKLQVCNILATSPDQEKCTYYASIILDAREHLFSKIMLEFSRHKCMYAEVVKFHHD